MAAPAAPSVYNVPEDGNEEQCGACGLPGSLLCCESCPAAYHAECAGYGVHLVLSCELRGVDYVIVFQANSSSELRLQEAAPAVGPSHVLCRVRMSASFSKVLHPAPPMRCDYVLPQRTSMRSPTASGSAGAAPGASTTRSCTPQRRWVSQHMLRCSARF